MDDARKVNDPPLDVVPAFRALGPDGRALLERGVRRLSAPADRVIVEKGGAVSGAYFVLSGGLRVFTLTPAGREAALYDIGPGETCVLALNGLFNDLLYPAWVRAETDTAVAVVPGRLYRDLFEREAAIRDLTVRSLSTLVFRLMAELEDVHALTVEQRLANFLVERASAQGRVRKTQQELAAHIGTSREVVGRLMARFADRGMVATRRGDITVLDAPALGRIGTAGEA